MSTDNADPGAAPGDPASCDGSEGFEIAVNVADDRSFHTGSLAAREAFAGSPIPQQV